MFPFPLLVLSTSFTVYALSQAAICTSSSGPLPRVKDCREIAEAVALLSRLPGENEKKAWGRNLPNTDISQRIPKVFWISGRGPRTCAIHVDVDAYDPLAVDEFRLSDVAAAGEEVINQCLLPPRRKVGLVYPAGPLTSVHAKVRFSEMTHSSSTPGTLDPPLPGNMSFSQKEKDRADLGNLVQIVRTDSPFNLGVFNQSDVQTFALPAKGETLQVATVNSAVLISLNAHALSNVTALES